MNKEFTNYQQYINILKEELKPAMGCTEPISIAFAASKAQSYLHGYPTSILVEVSGNILKNVKSVIVPNTGGLQGIKPSVAAGILFGECDKGLEVISNCYVINADRIRNYLDSVDFKIITANSKYCFDIKICLMTDNESASVRIIDNHMNIVNITYNNQVIYEKPFTGEEFTGLSDRSTLNVQDIYTFANIVKIEDVKDLLDLQINYNMAIAEEGLKNNYGANIGKVILKYRGNSTKVKAAAYAASASDARMNGCNMPVIINSGSGNQGIASSVPVIIFAQDLKVNKELLSRSLVVANLVTIHLKTGIGRLSAYCGAISAGIGAGAGIAYMETCDYSIICHTIVNALGILSGIVCDGAKASCAAKVASSVDAGILGYEMISCGNEFHSGDGLINSNVENTIQNIDLLASEGMIETDKKIIDIMLKSFNKNN